MVDVDEGEDLEEKKLLGSGGYVFAKLTEQEELRTSLGVPQIFLGSVGGLNEGRFSKYKADFQSIIAINAGRNILDPQ